MNSISLPEKGRKSEAACFLATLIVCCCMEIEGGLELI